MASRTIRVFAPVLFLVPAPSTAIAQAASTPRRDTVDVAPGTRHVDFSHHTASTSRAVMTRTVGAQSTTLPAILWRFAFTDTGGRPLLHVQSEPEQTSAGPPMPRQYVILDRRTLALRGIQAGAAPGPHANLVVDGTSVRGVMRLPPGAPGAASQAGDSVSITLPSEPFYAPLVDLVVESLPHKPGVVYRLPLWRPGPGAAMEIHLYETVRREDVEVLGKTHRQAYVVEERNADGSRLLGTMWLIERAPFLARWVINGADGSTTRLDQENVTK